MTGLRPWTLEECEKLLKKIKQDTGTIETIIKDLQKPKEFELLAIKDKEGVRYWEHVAYFKEDEETKVPFKYLKPKIIEDKENRTCFIFKVIRRSTSSRRSRGTE